MRPPHRLLDRTKVHRRAAEHRQAHLRFRDSKRKTSAQGLWSLLLAAAARITSLSNAGQRLDNAPSDETARQALCATRPDYDVLPQQLNAALAGHRPKTLRTHLQRRAIDLTLIPDHGKPFRDPEEIDRGQAKDGTSHSHADATASVVPHGQRSTVARTGVKKGAPLKDVVQRLLLWDRGLSSRRGCRSSGRCRPRPLPQPTGRRRGGAGRPRCAHARPRHERWAPCHPWFGWSVEGT